MRACGTTKAWWLGAILGAATVAACSAGPGASELSPGAPRNETSPTQPGTTGSKKKPAPAGACSLEKAGFTFERSGGGGGSCDQCIDATCCADVVGCFKDNADCAALNACIDKCKGGGGAPAADGGAPADAGAGTGTGTGNAAARTYFTGTLYPSVQPTCGSCHGIGGSGPQFFGTTADTSYQIFKNNQFHTGNGFTGKGAHQGPALTANQQQLVQQWKTLEAQGGGGGGTGGGGNGTGGGGGTGGGNGGACEQACYAAHPESAEVQKRFYQCRTVTCAAECP